MEAEYVSEIVLELQPRSHRGFRRFFGIRENKSFNEKSFDRIQFSKNFLDQFNHKILRRGQHIKCDNLVVGVKQIRRACSEFTGNTEVEFLLKGRQLRNLERIVIPDKLIEHNGTLNESFIDDALMKNRRSNLQIEVEQVYSCHCSECKKCLTDGDLYIKSGNWSRPILCVGCYESSFAQKCVRCKKAITFDYDSLTPDGLACVRFVQINDFYWHSDCCVCVTCLQSLIGKNYYQDHIYNQLFCLHHIPHELI